MKKYLSFFKLRFSYSLQYRAAAVAGVTTQFAWGSMLILLYKAFYESDPSAFPMEFSALASYMWLQQAFLALYNFWNFDNSILDNIVSGNIAYEMLRPMDIYNMWSVKAMAERIARALLRCAPILIVAFFLPKPYGISLPASPFSFAMFLITTVLAIIVVVSLGMLVYISTFYTMSPLGIRIVAMSLSEILGGHIIPLPFFPENIAWILELNPFASIANVPLRVYSGNIAGDELLRAVLLQLFWIAALQLIGRLWMNRSLKKVVVHGG